MNTPGGDPEVDTPDDEPVVEGPSMKWTKQELVDYATDVFPNPDAMEEMYEKDFATATKAEILAGIFHVEGTEPDASWGDDVIKQYASILANEGSMWCRAADAEPYDDPADWLEEAVCMWNKNHNE